MEILERWKRAVVHLECAADSVNIYDRIEKHEELVALLKNGEITKEELASKLSEGSRDIRIHGTALFLSHAGRRYLLTARHVVWDDSFAESKLEETPHVAEPTDSTMNPLLQFQKETAENKIFDIIFRVPNIDEVIAQKKPPHFLMNLGAGIPSTGPYIFSVPAVDLAIISLDQRKFDSLFADELQERGFISIPSEAIADGPDSVGQDVFTFGFPSSTALIDQVSPILLPWSSSYFSAPVASFGKVAMLHDVLDHYWADMSIYPGNSGGPVVAENRLVGIVLGQPMLPIDDLPNVSTRIPFAQIIKTKHVRKLLELQEEKDRRNDAS